MGTVHLSQSGWDSPAVDGGQRLPQAAALLVQALVQAQRGMLPVVRNTVLTQRTVTGGAVQVGYLQQGRDSVQLPVLDGPPQCPLRTLAACCRQVFLGGGASSTVHSSLLLSGEC